MLEKMKNNKNSVILVLAIIAGALMVPSFINWLENPASDHVFIQLIRYGLLLASVAVLGASAYLKKNMLAVAFVLFESEILFENGFYLYEYGQYSYIYHIVIAAAALILYFTVMANKKLFNVCMVLLLIQLAFYLVGVFGGNTYSFTCFITLGLIIYELYFERENKNEEV